MSTRQRVFYNSIRNPWVHLFNTFMCLLQTFLFFHQLIPDDMEFQSGDMPNYTTSDGSVCTTITLYCFIIMFPICISMLDDKLTFRLRSKKKVKSGWRSLEPGLMLQKLYALVHPVLYYYSLFLEKTGSMWPSHH